MHEPTEPACPVLSLARQFEEFPRQYCVSEERDFDLRMSEIAEAASYLSPKSTAGAAFQIMCVSAEIDMLNSRPFGSLRGISEVVRAEFLRSYTAFFGIPRWPGQSIAVLGFAEPKHLLLPGA